MTPKPANRAITAAEAAPEAEAEGTVTVRARHPLYEADAHRAPGDTFEVPASRAKALGNLVEPAEPNP